MTIKAISANREKIPLSQCLTLSDNIGKSRIETITSLSVVWLNFIRSIIVDVLIIINCYFKQQEKGFMPAELIFNGVMWYQFLVIITYKLCTEY